MNHEPILTTIRKLGYHVSVHRMQGGISLSGLPKPLPDHYVEMHASKDSEVHIARVEGQGPDVEFTCACELAVMVGD